MTGTGTVDEMYLSELHQQNTSNDQATLGSFTDEEKTKETTTIAVVSDPTGGIVEAADEFEPDLGMPSKLLNELRKVRSQIDTDDDVRQHNEAVERLDLKQKYKDYLQSDSAAPKVEALVERVEDGENITLVCFEKQPKWCHRHVLKEEIKKRLLE
jgi:uncharacterized protein YeaO (DUF488 family)